MPTVRRCARLLLVPGVLSLILPGAGTAMEHPEREPTEGQLTRRYGKPSNRDRVWDVAPEDRDLDRDGLSNRDDWDDDDDGLLDQDEDR